MQGGREFISVQFYCAYFLTASGWSELSIAVRASDHLMPYQQLVMSAVCTKSGLMPRMNPPASLHILCNDISVLRRLIRSSALQLGNMTVFYKQRDNLYFPVSAYVLPTSALRVPYSIVFGFLWAIIVYWAVGMDPSAGRWGC